MKKLLLAIAVPVLLMSCISSGEDITVHKDGSGQLIETFKIKRDYVGFLNLSDEPSDPNLIDMEALKKAAQAFGEGVTLTKVIPMPADSPYAGYQAYYTFTDISKIRANASPSTTPAPAEGEEDNRIHFDFTPGKQAVLTIIMPQDKKTAQTAEATDTKDVQTSKKGSENSEDPKMKEQLKQIYKDMHYWIKIAVDGKIGNTNARYVDASTVTLLDMTFDKIVGNDELFSKVTSDDSGDIDSYMDELTAAGVLIENQDKIEVAFQ